MILVNGANGTTFNIVSPLNTPFHWRLSKLMLSDDTDNLVAGNDQNIERAAGDLRAFGKFREI